MMVRMRKGVWKGRDREWLDCGFLMPITFSEALWS